MCPHKILVGKIQLYVRLNISESDHHMLLPHVRLYAWVYKIQQVKWNSSFITDKDNRQSPALTYLLILLDMYVYNWHHVGLYL